jgi:histidine triad (HIT) family protein
MINTRVASRETAMDCIFCKIAKQEIPAKIDYQDENVMVFNDINPQAPLHKLIVPKKHISTLSEVQLADHAILGHMMAAALNIAQENGISEPGYRLVINCNKDGGQTVGHIHMHLLAGRHMHWPPG